MKRLPLASALMGLTALLSACNNDFLPTTARLTVKIEGVPSAQVTVTNTTINTQTITSTVEGSKTFSELRAGDVFKVEGSAVGGYTRPDAQTVTLDGDKTVTLTYTQAPRGLEAERISGKVEGNTLKIGNVYAGADGATLIGQGSVDAANTLTLDLTNVVPPSLSLLFTGCKSGSGGTLPAVRGWGTEELRAYSPQGDLLGTITEQVAPGSVGAGALVVRLYAEAATTFRGTCQGSDGTLDLDVTVKAGWNLLVLSGSGPSLKLRNADPSARSVLKFRAADARVSALLNPSTLEFKNDDPVTAEVAFAQVGGYSGAVKLQTDDPNLTVEPNTLTLPVLAAQSASPLGVLGSLGLGEQRVVTSLKFRYKGTDNVNKPFELQVLDSAGKKVGSGSGTLNVQRAGVSLFASTSPLQVTSNASARLPFTANSVLGFAGAVTVRLEGLPGGVTANTASLNLSAGGLASGELTVQGGAGLKPGEYTASLVAEGGGRSARVPVKIVVPQPAVLVSVNGLDISGYQGGSASVTVSVASQYGYSGKVNLTLTELPTGVKAAPVAVEVTANATTTITVPLQIAADAALGTKTGRVVSDGVAGTGNNNTFSLTVRPGRTALGYVTDQIAPAAQGSWVLVSNASSGSSSTATLRRISAGQTARELTLTNSGSVRLLPIPGGDVYVITDAGSGGKIIRLKDDGSTTELSGPSRLASSYIGSAADASGGIWFLREVSSQIGFTKYGLSRWDPATQTVATVDETQTYNSSFSSSTDLVPSNSGAYLVYRGNSNSPLLLIDTAKSTVTPLPNAGGSVESVAVSDAGQVWFTSYGKLSRFNADNSVTSFTLDTQVALIGFDAATPGVLWVTGGGRLLKLDPASAAVKQSVAVDSNSRAFPNRDGGVTLIASEYVDGKSRSFLTVVR